MSRPLDIAPGDRFGRLVVTALAPSHNGRQYRCACDCGGEKVVAASDLPRGAVQSCGCLRSEGAAQRARNRNLTHGRTHSSTYRSWRAMLQRCTGGEARQEWRYYGGRGITVCDRWLSFENFLADMGERPEGCLPSGRALYTLDRINNEGHYEPGNCRWATWSEQNSNRRYLGRRPR